MQSPRYITECKADYKTLYTVVSLGNYIHFYVIACVSMFSHLILWNIIHREESRRMFTKADGNSLWIL